MEDILRKKIRLIINEMTQQDVDEMAQLEGAKYRPITTFEGQTKVGWLKELTTPGNAQKFKEGVTLIGWMINDEPVLFTCGNEIAQFIRENPEQYQSLKEKYGTNLRWSNTNLPACQPRRKKPLETLPVPGVEGGESKDFDIQRTITGEKQSAQNTMKRIFNPIIESEFGNETSEGKRFNEILNKRSIPEINPADRTHLDRFVEDWSNDKIEYRTHTYNAYNSGQDFLKSVLARIKGVETPEMKTYYLARQFNKNYRNWEEDKKNQEEYQGKTSVYNLDKRGYDELKLDVALKMIFEIIGERRGDSFTWKISMRNKFGRKSPEEYSINTRLKDVDYSVQLKEGGILDDRSIGVTKTVQLDPEERIGDDNTIMAQLPVQLGLKEAIEDFKKLVESLTPNSALKIANIRQYDVKKGLDESTTNLIFNKLMNKFKK